MTVPYVHQYVECDSVYYEAKLTAFTADHHSSPSYQDILKDEQFSGCGDLYPYAALYYAKEGILTSLKNAPTDHANTVHPLKRGEFIRKIKTINNEWIYASLRDSGIPTLHPNISGYIKLKEVSPVN